MFKLSKVTILLIICITAFLLSTIDCLAYRSNNVTLTVMVTDSKIELKPVKNIEFYIYRTFKRSNFLPNKVDTRPMTTIKTGLDGTAEIYLPVGSYVIKSKKLFELGEFMYEWDYSFEVNKNEKINIDLSNSNAIEHELFTSFQRKRPLEHSGTLDFLKDGVVSVETDNGTCSGFIVDDSGLILTTYNIVKDSLDNRVLLNYNLKQKAKLVATLPRKNLAILVTDISSYAEIKALPLVNNVKGQPMVKTGEKVITIVGPTYNKKYIINAKITELKDNLIFTDYKITDQMAGSPVLNSAGEVVGINLYTNYYLETKPAKSEIIYITEALDLIDIAKKYLHDGVVEKPVKQIIPTYATETYPLGFLMSAKKSIFKTRKYTYDASPYKVSIYSPPLYYFLDEHNKLRKNESRDEYRTKASEKAAKYLNKDFYNINSSNTFKELSFWADTPEEFKPFIIVEVIPETEHIAGKYLYMSRNIGKNIIKRRDNFNDLFLTINGRHIEPIKRGKVLNSMLFLDYYKKYRNKIYSALYFYDPEILKIADPNKPVSITLTLVLGSTLTHEIKIELKESTIKLLYEDFEPYFNRKN